jgi:hypothetical protein
MGTKPKKASKPAPSAVLNGNTAGAFTDAAAPKRSAVEYSPEVSAAICERLALGKSLRSICEQPGMPCRSTIVRWLVVHEEFRLNYHHAREVGLDHFAEGLMRKATDVPPDMVNSVRLEVDTGKWLLSKMSKWVIGTFGRGSGSSSIRMSRSILILCRVRTRILSHSRSSSSLLCKRSTSHRLPASILSSAFSLVLASSWAARASSTTCFFPAGAWPE